MRSGAKHLLLAGALALSCLVVLVSGSVAALSGAAQASFEGPAAPPPAAGRMSVAQIGTYASAAGFSGSGLVMAIAVSMAESGGDPAATDHDSNGTVDRGLWQINSIHSSYSAACDYDPACAASAAYESSDHGSNWSPWVTYQRGEEIPYIQAALAWVNSRGGQG